MRDITSDQRQGYLRPLPPFTALLSQHPNIEKESALIMKCCNRSSILVTWALLLGSSCAFVSRTPVVPLRRGSTVTTPTLYFDQQKQPGTTTRNRSNNGSRLNPRKSDKPSSPVSASQESFVERVLGYAKDVIPDTDGGVLDWSKFKPTGSDKTWLGRAQGYANGMEAKLDEVSDWILSYSDLTPDTERTWVGQSFLATNVAYTLAGFYLTQNGDFFFGLITEITAIASFAYHYFQLESRGVNSLPSVRLALLIDYVCAFFSIGVALFYLFQTGGEHILTVLPPSILALGTLGASWVWVKGRPYMILHGLWHFFSAYTGYLVGVLHAGAM